VSDLTTDDLHRQEILARIANLNADTAKKLAESTSELTARINNLQADMNKKQAEIRIAPWQMATGGFTAGAAILAAVLALLKYLGGGL